MEKSRTSSMVKAGCENGCARTFHGRDMNSLSQSLQAQMMPRNENSLLSKVVGIKVWFCSILKVKEHHLKSWRERTVCQENASSCLLSRLKDRAGKAFISASAQTAKPLTNLGVYLGLPSRKEIYETYKPFPYPYFIKKLLSERKTNKQTLKKLVFLSKQSWLVLQVEPREGKGLCWSVSSAALVWLPLSWLSHLSFI